MRKAIDTAPTTRPRSGRRTALAGALLFLTAACTTDTARVPEAQSPVPAQPHESTSEAAPTVSLESSDAIRAKLREESGPVSGKLRKEQLRSIDPSFGPHQLYPDAAVSFRELALAYHKDLGEPVQITDSYRRYADQEVLEDQKPRQSAVAGTSEHGWGLAVDLTGGAEQFGTDEHNWLLENADEYGWRQPAWAQEGGVLPQPQHWQYFGGVTIRLTQPATS